MSLEDGPRIENLQYKYKIFNNGPSTIKELSLSVQLPLFYVPKPNYHIKLVEFENIDIRGFYTNKVYDVTWNKGDKIWLQTRDGTDGHLQSTDINNNMNHQNSFDTSKLGFDYELNADKTQEYDTLGQSNHRRKRSPWQNADDNENIYRVYNQYTGAVDEYTSSYRISVDKEDPTLVNLPKNRTIVHDCSSELLDDCIEANFVIHNFRPGSEPITLSMNFSLDLTKFGKHFLISKLVAVYNAIFLFYHVFCLADQIFSPTQNIFVYKTNVKFSRAGDESMRTLKITTRNPYTIVYEKLTSKTPIWIWIVSTIVGLLLLIILCYTLYRLGFFNRTQKEELERLTRESTRITAEEAEELKNLNV